MEGKKKGRNKFNMKWSGQDMKYVGTGHPYIQWWSLRNVPVSDGSQVCIVSPWLPIKKKLV